jgi:hypothetical protein
VAVAGLLFSAVCSAAAFPTLGRERSAATLCREVAVLSSGRPLVTVEKQLPSLCFYLDRVPEWVGADKVAERASRPDLPVLVIDQIDLPRLPAGALKGIEEVGRSGRYRVFVPRTPSPAQLDGP